MDLTTVVGIAVAIIGLTAGNWCLVRYGRTKDRIWLIAGLLFTLAIPGIVLLGLLCSAWGDSGVRYLFPG